MNKEIRHFIENAQRDRNALIIPEDQEEFTRKNIRGIRQAICEERLLPYHCAGILVRQSHSGAGWHVTYSRNVASIIRNGMRPTNDNLCTFGGGVIYAAQDLGLFDIFDTRFALFRCFYGPGILRAIAAFDKEDIDQGELVIPPECLTHADFICYGDPRNPISNKY